MYGQIVLVKNMRLTVFDSSLAVPLVIVLEIRQRLRTKELLANENHLKMSVKGNIILLEY